MTMSKLPPSINPFKFAEQRQMLEGIVSLKHMTRLAEVAGQAFDGKAVVCLEGDVDGQGVRFLKGTVETTLSLTCQRCLEPMEYQIKTEFLASAVSSEEEANLLSSQYDPLILEGNELSLSAFVEEELILALPVVPLHDEKACSVKRQLNTNEKRQPFKNLNELIRGE